MRIQNVTNRLRSKVFGSSVSVYYDPSYRFPLSSLEGQTGFEPRRADYVVRFLLDEWVLDRGHIHAPAPVSYREIARVHKAEYLERVGQPQALASIFALDSRAVPVDELMKTVRMCCGGTLEAARISLHRQGPSMNLLGGFHHAAPDRGAGFCVLNDLAIAVFALRQEGFNGYVTILDFDAHPPDGTLECFRDDEAVWIGSLSGSDWGTLPGVDETVLPARCDDKTYLKALDALLDRMPSATLTFVIAGGDVLAGDRLGTLGLSLAGARQRDLRVSAALRGKPSVWLPGGGYHPDAWKVLAGTGLALLAHSTEPISESYDPMRAQFSRISANLDTEALGLGEALTGDDIAEALGLRPSRTPLLLDYYTAQGLEYGFQRYGLLDHLRRLGYEHFHVKIDKANVGESLRCYGHAEGKDHLLVECIVDRKDVEGLNVLYVHWLMLSNPMDKFSSERPKLPGQEMPGLGLAREAGEMLARMADRLNLKGVMFRPAWYHTAFSARYRFVFINAKRQGRFEAMLRDFAGVPLLKATLAVAEGRVLMNGEPYTWEADEMVFWLRRRLTDIGLVDEERRKVRFEIVEQAAKPD